MLTGIAAAAVALGVAQLLGIGFGPRADALNGVGSAVIDLTPGAAKKWAIRTFGAADKLFVLVMVVAVIAGVAAGARTWERRRVAGGNHRDRHGCHWRMRGDHLPPTGHRRGHHPDDRWEATQNTPANCT